MKKVIAIVGPTGSGKTFLAIKLAQKFNGEIISADSRSIYRGLDIGTAKPTAQERKIVRHHLIDIVNVGERFTVVEFQKLATKAIDDISRRRKTPFLVGGTGLYVDAVLKNYQFPPAGDSELRFHLEREPTDRLLNILETIDPRSFRRVDHHNRRRVLRAVEVALQTGQSFLSFRQSHISKYDYIILGIQLPRSVLYERLDQRFEEWIDRGLLKEIRWALSETSPDWVDSLGLHYRFLSQYVQGIVNEGNAFEKSKSSLHAYAKRQMTWFRRDKKLVWIKTPIEAEKVIQNFLQDASGKKENITGAGKAEERHN